MIKSTIILLTCILLGIAVLCGLGTWQLKRLAWKNALIERVETALKSPPLEPKNIIERIEAGQDIEFRPSNAVGSFLHDLEQHFFATHNGRSGYYVYTPLELESRQILFINRGFVPLLSKSSANRVSGQLSGKVAITGLARSAPLTKPNSFVPDNDLVQNIFYWKSLSQMSERAFPSDERRILPYYLDANSEKVPGGLPIGGVTLISFPNSHLQYALTWFGLAFALFCVGGIFVTGQHRARKTR